jgi:hypothetical protein
MARVVPPPLKPLLLMRGCSLDELIGLWSTDAFAEHIAIERHGIEIRIIKDLAVALRWTPIELFRVLGMPGQPRLARNDYRGEPCQPSGASSCLRPWALPERSCNGTYCSAPRIGADKPPFVSASARKMRYGRRSWKMRGPR